MNREICGQLVDELENLKPEMGHTLVKSIESAKTLSFENRVEIQKSRTELNRLLWHFFDRFDLLLTPTMPTEAFSAKGPPPGEIEGVPIPLLGAVAFTYPFNLSGHPAATVPVGFTPSGLPAGLQIVGPRHEDERVLQAAFQYEKAHPWNDCRPGI
jgi:aspartyl-tRNA(Asn)/glutamyl-tRNA(Gln) amidotransferase subunit A